MNFMPRSVLYSLFCAFCTLSVLADIRLEVEIDDGQVRHVAVLEEQGSVFEREYDYYIKNTDESGAEYSTPIGVSFAVTGWSLEEGNVTCKEFNISRSLLCSVEYFLSEKGIVNSSQLKLNSYLFTRYPEINAVYALGEWQEDDLSYGIRYRFTEVSREAASIVVECDKCKKTEKDAFCFGFNRTEEQLDGSKGEDGIEWAEYMPPPRGDSEYVMDVVVDNNFDNIYSLSIPAGVSSVVREYDAKINYCWAGGTDKDLGDLKSLGIGVYVDIKGFTDALNGVDYAGDFIIAYTKLNGSVYSQRSVRTNGRQVRGYLMPNLYRLEFAGKRLGSIGRWEKTGQMGMFFRIRKKGEKKIGGPERIAIEEERE